jgi:uncharacterized protein YkwD
LALAVLIVVAILLIGRLWQPASPAPAETKELMTRSAETTNLAAATRRKGTDTATPARPTATKTPTPIETARSEQTPTETARPKQTPTETARPKQTPTETARPKQTPTETARPKQTPTETARPKQTPTETARPKQTPTPSHTPARVTLSATATAALNELYERINRIRRQAGLAELTPSADLVEAAQAHAADMAEHQTLSHTGSDGSDVGARIRRTGYKPAAWGEIIASVTGGPEEAVTVWWNSAPHREIMLTANFREFGAGRAKHRGEPLEYYVVVFGRR